MAIKPTIYKFKIDLSDVDRNHYDTLNLTVALHPSENPERMMARLMAFCLNAREDLSFTKGLCAVEEPDIWARTPDDRIDLWIDMGEPSADRIKKAARQASEVSVYAFHFNAEGWWQREASKFDGLDVSVYLLQWGGIQTLAGMVRRTMDLSVTVSDGTIYLSCAEGECEIVCTPLQVTGNGS
ncbi:MAG: YaeQ family protein [Desulfobacterales bacterium]|nr:YaeQ family protein [Desulfobacterales bacterium]